MASDNQGGDRLRCPTLADNIGEDPARWLDWDLLADSQRAEIVRTLIDGIDTLERLRAFRAVEMRLANDRYADDARNPLDEPRAAIMQRLDQREQWLDLHGERPDRLPDDIDKSCNCCDADSFATAAELRERRDAEWSRRSDGYSPASANEISDESETEATALDAFATDGGEPE